MRITNMCFNKIGKVNNAAYIYIICFAIFLIPPALWSQSTGPESGSCLIIGGGKLDGEIYQLFLLEAGGPDANIVIIPTAGSYRPEERDSGFVKLQERFIANGIKQFKILHSTDRAVADSRSFADQIKAADGIWFTGGRQWRLVDAYAGTLTEAAFQHVLDNGGIIAGTSAGATIQGSFLARGDTQTNTLMMGDHQIGFGYIENVAIDQHVIARNRQFDLFEILEAHPHLLGIGLDEGAGMLIHADTAEIVGRSYVIIDDNSEANNSQMVDPLPKSCCHFYFLQPGQKYNLREKKIIH